MTPDHDQWIRERARDLSAMSGHGLECACSHCEQKRAATRIALHEAIARERERIRSLLEEPSEEMGRAVLDAIAAGDPAAFIGEYEHGRTITIDGKFDVLAICRSLAAKLEESAPATPEADAP